MTTKKQGIIEQGDNYVLYTYEAWEDKYKPIERTDGDILFDTHAPQDVKRVKDYIAEHGILHVWTLCHEGDEVYIDTGYRRVNRLSYIITEVPRESANLLVQAEY